MRRRPPSRKGASCLFLVVVAALGAAAATISFFFPVQDEDEFHMVSIPPGAGVREIGDILAGKSAEEGSPQIIRSSTAFWLVVKLMKKDRSLVAGEYRLSPGMSLYRVIRTLEMGRVVTAPVTFPEGVTVAQMADLLAGRGFVVADEFLELCKSGGRTFQGVAPFVASDNLEGYLFPDTYKFARGADARAIIAAMLRNFGNKMEEAALEKRGAAEGYSDYELLIMASMVEKEAKAPQDRARIAGVLFNRLKRGMRLQCDATIQYARVRPKERLLIEDTKINSPYNTYLYDGLPPGPICNPGMASIEAAYQPEAHSCLYYVARPDGTHIFSRTFQEHRRAKAEARAGVQR